MAGLSFRFDGRESPVRRWDIRFRVAAAAGFSAFAAAGPEPGLPLLAAEVAVGLGLAGCRWSEGLRVVRGFLPFLVFFYALGLAFEPTVAQAAFLGWQSLRLTLLLLGGHLLLLAATPGDVAEGLRWYLGWLGRRRAWAAAGMAGWALASVPLALDQPTGVASALDLHRTLEEHYRGEPFVRVMPFGGETLEDGYLDPTACNDTNRLELFVFGTDTQAVVAARLDNLGKGASGAAVQCLNVHLGLDEATGLPVEAANPNS